MILRFKIYDFTTISNAKVKVKTMLELIKDEQQHETQDTPANLENLTPGQEVFIPSINKHGIVDSIKKKKVRLNVDSIKITMPLNELTKSDRKNKANNTKSSYSSINLINPSDVQIVVDVRGLRSNAAIEKVKKHLDSGLLNNLDFVKILHGKGTGALKNSIHRHLESEKYVKKIEFESPDAGGEGITIVHIK